MHPAPAARNLSLEFFCIEGTNFQLSQQHLIVPTNTVSAALKPNDNLEGNLLLLSLLNTPVRQNHTYRAMMPSKRAGTPWLRLYPGRYATLTTTELLSLKAASLPQLKRHSEIL